MEQRAVQLLEEGVDGGCVLQSLRDTCASVSALRSMVSRVRLRYLSQLPRLDVDAMAPFASNPEVAAFCTLSRTGMVHVQREHQSNPTWGDEAEEALAALPLVPTHVASLRLTKADLVALKRVKRATLLRKQETLVHIHHADSWLAHTIQLARSAHVSMDYAQLILPLLLLSGRRTGEIANGSSEFMPTWRATTCVFSGQLKKRGASAPYEIPLLCDYGTFMHALGVLRAKQCYETLDTVACNARYAVALNSAVTRLYPMATNPHVLRQMYAAFAFHLYASTTTFNRCAMQMLGHDDLEVSLSYNSVVLHGHTGAGTYGLLP